MSFEVSEYYNKVLLIYYYQLYNVADSERHHQYHAFSHWGRHILHITFTLIRKYVTLSFFMHNLKISKPSHLFLYSV